MTGLQNEHANADMELSPQKLAILEVAQAMFRERGYDGLSIRDLAEACGLAKATIYHHFRDKEDLLFRVLERDLRTQYAPLMQVAAGTEPALKKLRAAISVYYQLMSKRRAGVMWSIHANAEIKEHMQAFLRAQMPVILDPWVRILNQGITEGDFRPLDVQTSAFSILALASSMLIYQASSAADQSPADPTEHVFNFATRGILQT